MRIPEKTPIFVSFPRSGCIWIQAMMEIYFDAPRGPDQTGGLTWRPPKKDEKFMWFHTHDHKLSQKESGSEAGDLFLYRNPVDAIYSLINGPDPLRKNYTNEAVYFKKLFKKWTPKAKTILTYEEVVNDTLGALKKISKHFNKPWKIKNAKIAIETCTKENMLSKGDKVGSTWHNSRLNKNDYINNRKIFYEKHAEEILKIIEDREVKPLLENVLK